MDAKKKLTKNNCVFEPAGQKGCTFFCARGGFLLPQSEDLRVNWRLLIARRCEYDWLFHLYMSASSRPAGDKWVQLTDGQLLVVEYSHQTIKYNALYYYRLNYTTTKLIRNENEHCSARVHMTAPLIRPIHYLCVMILLLILLQ